MTDKEKITLPDQIVINSARLEKIIDDHIASEKKARDWKTPAGILFTFITCYLVTDFKPRFSIPAESIELIFIISSILLTALVIYLAFKESSKTTPDYKEAIHKALINKPDYTVIYFIKLTLDNIPRLLVEEKKGKWDCFFLPYVARKEGDIFNHEMLKQLKSTISNYLGINGEQIEIDHLDNLQLSSSKISRSDGCTKQYFFDFFFVSIPKESMVKNYEQYPFSIAGKTYHWKTIDELESDPKTLDRNGDILKHLKENRLSLFDGKDSLT